MSDILLQKIINKENIIYEDLNSYLIVEKCPITVFYVDKTYYSYGINYYDKLGNIINGG